MGKVDVNNGNLNTLTCVDHQTTTPGLSCAAAISVPMHRVEARDLLGGILLAELRSLDQCHVNSVALQDDSKLV